MPALNENVICSKFGRKGLCILLGLSEKFMLIE